MTAKTTSAQKKTQHCCQEMLRSIDDTYCPVVYKANIRDYQLSLPMIYLKKNDWPINFRIDFCIFCGSQMPKNLTEQWWNLVYKKMGEEISLADEEKLKKIPEDLRTDAWWKKRNYKPVYEKPKTYSTSNKGHCCSVMDSILTDPEYPLRHNKSTNTYYLIAPEYYRKRNPNQEYKTYPISYCPRCGKKLARN